MDNVIWFVCSGVNIGHFWDVKPCRTLKEAKLYASELPVTPDGRERPYHIERWRYKNARASLGTEAESSIVFRNYD
jgi:hypothetical protein